MGARTPDFHVADAGRTAIRIDGLPLQAETPWDTYARSPEKILSLRGEFAIALSSQDRLILARDPAGRRPLFFRQDEDGIAFGSTPMALAPAASIERDWLARQLLLLPDRDASTGFSGVRRVLPGEVLAFHRPDAPPLRWRWTPQFAEPLHRSTDAAAEELYGLLDQALDRICQRQSRIAMQLSSGLDSAILLSRLGGRKSLGVDAYTAVPSRTPEDTRTLADEWDHASSHSSLFANVRHHRVEGPSSALLEARNGFALYQQPLMNMCNGGWLDAIAGRASHDGHQLLIEGLAGNFTVTHASGGRLSTLAARSRWGGFLVHALRRGGRGSRTALRRNPPPGWRRFRSGKAAPEFLRFHFLRDDSERLRAALEDERRLGRMPERVDGIDDPHRRYFEFLQHRDDALFRHGMRVRHGISLCDPFADPEVMDFAMRLEPEAFGPPGSRALGYALLDPRIDQNLVRQGARAPQGENWRDAAVRDRGLALELVEWASAHDGIGAMVDLDALRGAIRQWPEQGWDSAAQVDRYRMGLMRTLGMLAFAQWAEERA